MSKKRRKQTSNSNMKRPTCNMSSASRINHSKSIDRVNTSALIALGLLVAGALLLQAQAQQTQQLLQQPQQPQQLQQLQQAQQPPSTTTPTTTSTGSGGPSSQVQFDGERNAYTGLTFTFDPRLDRRVEWLHSDHWLSIVQQSSQLLYEALNGRAHLAEVRVLIPYKWRQFEWPVLHKPGSPIMANRRLRFADADILVGPEDANYKETPFAVQHDECGQKGLHIRMPISFLEETSAASSQAMDVRLKGRQLVREFASHRFGIFKESGFRADFMYPPFTSLPGLGGAAAASAGNLRWASARNSSTAAAGQWQLDESQPPPQPSQVRGFDEAWNECPFETNPSSGLPASPNNAQCLPYLTAPNTATAATNQGSPKAGASFNLMSADPFSYVDVSAASKSSSVASSAPLSWRQLAGQTGDQVRWHFCGQNFQPVGVNDSNNQLKQQPTVGMGAWFEHNERAANKQNKLCQERSALDVIRASDDFRRSHSFSPSNFNRLPAAQFKFLQEMPPRVIICFEYTGHLYQSRRLDHTLVESAVNKYLALDLIADSEVATVVFGQHSARAEQFQRLDSASLSSRFALFNPAIDPYDETVQMYSQAELRALDVQSALGQQARIIKGTCSLARLLAEVNQLLARAASQYDDVGADLIVITSGLFVEDEHRIEELIGSSQFKVENNRLNLIIYPSTMLFDTKSRDGFIVLDSLDSEQIIRSRLAKLLLIRRLTGAHIHLVKEHLDANGDVKLASTLVQFYQIFDHISKGNSWDQTQSMQLLDHKTVDSRPIQQQQQQQQQVSTTSSNQSSKLTYHFEVDASIQNELFVGFIDPKQSSLQAARLGKRFSLKSLQLRSPGGQLIFTETSTWTGAIPSSNQTSVALGDVPVSDGLASQSNGNNNHHQQQPAFFPYRAQLSWAAFHLKPQHLQQLNATNRLAGTWTLSAISEEPMQTSAVALAKVNPAGDTVTANCWIQTYYSPSATGSELEQQQQLAATDQQLKTVKVFAQVRGRSVEAQGRMEVQDQLGNIVQNVNMLDDGLGSPDITKGDGILSQYVQRAYRPGFYKVLVELGPGAASQPGKQASSSGQQPKPTTSGNGQDNVCCGSFIPQPQPQPDSRHLSRQLYCGTFHVDQPNRLAEQRPPRVNNLTVVNIDQDQRRVTVRWFEPQLDIAVHGPHLANNQQLEGSFNDLLADESRPQPSSSSINKQEEQEGGQEVSGKRRRQSTSRRHAANIGEADLDDGDSEDAMSIDRLVASPNPTQIGRGVVVQTGGSRLVAGLDQLEQQAANNLLATNRYEIKMFTDREMIRRAFDGKHEVGFKFNEWNVDGQLPNATAYGGPKEVTLRIPNGREGVYFIAMKVYNNVGLASATSNIVQFYMRNNATAGDEAESIYGQVATIDADGNMYDKNGYLLQRGGGGHGGSSGSNQLNYSLLRGATNLDGLSVLILFSLLAFLMSVVCISLVACLASSARKSLISSSTHKGGNKKSKDDDKTPAINSTAGSMMTGAGSGSSMASSSSTSSSAGVDGGGQSTSSQHSEVASSVCGGSQVGLGATSLGHDGLDMGRLVGTMDELSYGNLREQQQHQLSQAQLIHNQHLMISSANQQHQFQQQQQQHNQNNYQLAFETEKQQLARMAALQQQQQPPLQHTVVNGYTYATVNGANRGQQQQHQAQMGDLNENGLSVGDELTGGSSMMSPIQSWPADILLSHYDKVKQARERNEAPPVMSFDGIHQQDQSGAGGQMYLTAAAAAADGQLGLPLEMGGEREDTNNNYLSRQRLQQHQANNYQFNQQLQQQLSSVLKNKNKRRHAGEMGPPEKSSPALEGVRGDFEAMSPAPQTLQSGADFDSDIYGSNRQHQTAAAAPPPPQYIYCTPGQDGQPGDSCGLATHLTDPSIYSQSTNLQQVVAADSSTGGQSYYANQNNLWQQQHQQPIYGTNSIDQQQQQQQQQGFAADEMIINYDKSNSAISEV